ncbi:MAG: hypothetical protein Q9220_002398 [cf. Caloplaca sp. 1 TL-2023]
MPSLERPWPNSSVRPRYTSNRLSKSPVEPRLVSRSFHTSTTSLDCPATNDSARHEVDSETSREAHIDENCDLDVEIDGASPLGYYIPSTKMRESMLASSSSRSAYWQYSLYDGPKGEKVKVHYCRSLETTQRIARLFLNESVIGFDIEWKPSATTKDGIRKNVSLIQLASEERIALFHVARFSKDDKIESLVSPTVKQIMESSSITKVGVSVKGDCSRLRKYMNIESRGLLELSHLYKLVKFSATNVKKINKMLVALAKQVEEHLMLPMYKDQNVRASDWSEDLNYDQIYYAASDSYAGFQLYHTLNKKRLALSPIPPLPEHAELNLPIRLANGQTVAEYEVPVSEDSPPEADDGSTPPLPPTEQLAEETLNLQIEDQPSASKESAEPKPGTTKPPSLSLSTHPSIIAANDWIAHFRTLPLSSSSRSTDFSYPNLNLDLDPSSPPPPAPSSSQQPETRTSPPRATLQQLRAYFLFHHHSLSISDIAALLRDPPLKEATVAGYVLEATRIEGLELGRGGREVCVGFLPKGWGWGKSSGGAQR